MLGPGKQNGCARQPFLQHHSTMEQPVYSAAFLRAGRLAAASFADAMAVLVAATLTRAPVGILAGLAAAPAAVAGVVVAVFVAEVVSSLPVKVRQQHRRFVDRPRPHRSTQKQLTEDRMIKTS